MGYGKAPTSSHFTGKKKAVKNNVKRVVREKQQPHKNKYEKYSKVS